MKMSKFYILFFSMCSLSASCFARDFETWSENMVCGEVQYKLESICKKAKKEMTLNECKSQSLEIIGKGMKRKVTLPELNRSHLDLFKDGGGELHELFLVQWGCGEAAGVSEAIFYYSTGGGSSENSETSASYNEIGVLMNDENRKNPNYAKALKDARQHMRPVHSIMPN